MWTVGQTAAGGQQLLVGPPAPPPLPAPSLHLSYIDQTVPHFTQIPQMFQLYYQGAYCTHTKYMLSLIVKLHKHPYIYFSILFDVLLPPVLYDCIYISVRCIVIPVYAFLLYCPFRSYDHKVE